MSHLVIERENRMNSLLAMNPNASFWTLPRLC
jgi:hypothetical protein